jgi:iron complex outermembrane receptor protein
MNVPFRQDMRFQSYGAFGELTYQLNPQNKIVTGARVDQVTVDDERADSKAKGLIPSLKNLTKWFYPFGKSKCRAWCEQLCGLGLC